MQSPSDRVEILRQEAAAFKERVAALATEDWDRPSACVGWSVADVVAHLSGQAFALNVGRGLQGDYSPPPDAAPVTEHNEDEFARNIFQRAFNTRAEFGEAICRRSSSSVSTKQSICLTPLKQASGTTCVTGPRAPSLFIPCWTCVSAN